MYWQRKNERTSVSMTLNNTYKLLLPVSGLLGSLMIKISGTEATGLGYGVAAWRIIDFISQIQVVVNGSVVKKSLTPYQAHALAMWDQGVTPPSEWRNYATNTQYDYFLINFGRWFKDANCGLDLSKYQSVELWITNTATASYFTDLTVTVESHYLAEAPAAQFPYFLQTIDWNIWTTVADQWQYLNLPVDFPIRRIMLQAIPPIDANMIEKTNMHNLMDEIKFLLDTGQTVVFDGDLELLMRENYFELRNYQLVGGWPYMENAYGIRMDLGYQLYGAAGGGSQAGTVATVIPTIDSARSSFTQVGYSYSADHPISIFAAGMAYMESALLNTNQDDDPSTYLDPKARYQVQLNIHTRNSASAAGGYNHVVLDQLVPAGK